MVNKVTQNFNTPTTQHVFPSGITLPKDVALKLQKTIGSFGRDHILPICDPRAGELWSIVNKTPTFKGYKVGLGTGFNGTLTELPVRPANLFFDALLGPGSVTLPGSYKLFAFTKPLDEIRKQIASADPDQIV